MKNPNYRRAYQKYMVTNGRLIGTPSKSLFETGGPALMEWLALETPEGASVSDTLAAIALDAMHEEQDNA